MEITATARNIRMTPRKVSLLAGLIRGLSVAQADAQLSFNAKAAAYPVLKLLRSAVANARHNANLDPDTLKVKAVLVDAGATLKRFRPRAFGRAATIRKRSCHIKIILTDGKPVTADAQTSAPKAAAVAPAVTTDAPKKKTTRTPRAKAVTA